MMKPRLLSALALAATLVLPGSAVMAQQEIGSEPPAESPAVTADTRLEELQALVPESLAGLALRENLQLVTGEELAPRMAEDERAVFEEMLAANGKTLADYAAASAAVEITDSEVVIVQPHRVSGIDAAGTLDAWVEIMALNAVRPAVAEQTMAGRDVVVVSDDAQPDFPRLHIFAGGDVVWMVVAADQALVEEAVRSLSATADDTPSDG